MTCEENEEECDQTKPGFGIFEMRNKSEQSGCRFLPNTRTFQIATEE